MNITFRQRENLWNTVAIPTASYMGSMLIFGQGQLAHTLKRAGALNTEVRGIMIENDAKQLNTSKDRVFLSSKEMGYGMKSIRDAIENSLVYLLCYIMLEATLYPTRTLLQTFTSRNRRNIQRDVNSILEKYEVFELVRTNPTTGVICVDGKDHTVPVKQRNTSASR
uniref:Uncharacterized protein n=1 Tax=Ditylenchus dipsaci TaxID=166011 RepID=A0A915CRD1_9BILA